MNKINVCLLLFFITVITLLGDMVLDDRTPPWEYPFLTPGDVDINIKTEKDKYCLGELITLDVEICNLTDRKIAINNVSNYLIDYFGVEVLDPYRPQKKLKFYKENGTSEDYVIEEHKPSPVSRTRKGAQKQGLIKPKDYIIAPKGKLIFRLPLSLYFDFSNTAGTYSVSIACDLLKEDYMNMVEKKRELIIKKSCKFVLKDEAMTSISRMTADYMCETLGRENAIDVLCCEAESLINGFKGRKEDEWSKSSEYERLRRILAASCRASGIYHTNNDLDYMDEHNLMRLEEFEKLVQRCRARRLKMVYNEASRLLSSMKKMEGEKWKESEEYSKFKITLESLSKQAGIGYEEKNFDHLVKNDLLDLEEIGDLFYDCELKLCEVIPFYRNP